MNSSHTKLQTKQRYKIYLKNTVLKGRGLYVKSLDSIPAGSVIFKSSPYAFVLNYQHWATHCFNCFQYSKKKLKRCLGCQCVFYCTVECQKQDWVNHKNECKNLTSFLCQCRRCNVVDEDITDFLLVARTLRRLRVDKETIPLISLQETLSKADSECLVTHWNYVESMCVTQELQKDPKVVEALMATQLLGSLVTSKEELYVWLNMFQCNNFSITDDRMVCIGAGVYAVGSLLNHSCRPNCIYTFDPITKTQVCRCVQELKSDDELLIPYIDIVFSTKERRQMLLALYGFFCSCNVCENPINLRNSKVSTLDEALRGDRWGRQLPDIYSMYNPLATVAPYMQRDRKKILARIIDQLKSPQKMDVLPFETVIDWVSTVNKCFLEYSEQQGNYLYKDELFVLEHVLHPFNLDLYSKRCEVFSLALEQKNYSLAIHLGEQMTTFLTIVYQNCPHHPLLGLHYYSMYELYLETGNTVLAKSLLNKTYDCLKICYGVDHNLVLSLC
ncbi:N-lysine methyltransferase SMYD2-like isoform X2 [Hylaeus volcanicus]|uniref:N-lysine methyltransferase SMYD2-like isoform X2 n=1 Tax=Hylaeus volcanicus TaxID=313075 RepID=UPI0023B85D31|nr:N-lysine methyltransferase SMYD2-like isoform X2 [Hylaeus volcanicus]